MTAHNPRRHGLPRMTSWYLLGAVSLTVLWLLACGLAPATGLTRSYYYPVSPSTLPLAEEQVAAVDLAFVDEQDRPVRNYLVRWRGVWFSPRSERLDFHAAADDGAVVVQLDGETVLRLTSRPRATTVKRTVQLEAGAHELEIYYWQREGRQQMRVQWAPAGGVPAPLGPSRLFPQDPGMVGYWALVASLRLPMLVLLAWVGGAAVPLARSAYRRVSVLSGRELRTRLGAVLFPALLGPSQLLLFGPWTVHSSNQNEFLVSFWGLAPQWIWLLGPVVGILAGLGVILPAAWFQRYVAALFALGVLLWVQGNLLVADYGLLDGGGLDLASHAWRAPFELGLWVVAVALATVFAAAVVRVATAASSLLVALQATALLLPGTALPAGWSSVGPAGGNAVRWRLPPAEIYELSSTRNLIHIVLDMFPTHTFAEILESDRPLFDRHWSGFTFFRDHLGAFRTTKASMPAMLTGVAYRNEMPFQDFIVRPSVFHALGQQGYRLRAITSLPSDFPTRSVPGAEAAIQYGIPRPYGSYADYLDATSAQLLDLSLFRHAPHGAKAGVYREAEWLLQSRVAERRRTESLGGRPFGDTTFLLEFASRITPVGDSPTYTFVHLITPHPPLVMDANCTYRGRRPRSADHFTEQARCALLAVQTVLDRLRALDLYDSSAIVVTSDHGAGRFRPRNSPFAGMRSPGRDLDWIVADATTLLLIKPVDAQGPLRTSYAPTSLTDLPATLFGLANLPNTPELGTSALTLDPATVRERIYAHHSYGRRNTYTSPYFDVLHLFAVSGPSSRPENWRYRRAIFEPTDDPEGQRRSYRVGLSAVADPTAGGSGRHVYRTDEYAAFFVAPDAGQVTFDVRKARTGAPAQIVTVKIDGRVVDRYRLEDDSWYSVTYPIDSKTVENSPYCVELVVRPVRRDPESTEGGVLVRGDL